MDKAIQLVMVAAVAVLVAAAIASMFMGQSEGFTGFLDQQRDSAQSDLVVCGSYTEEDECLDAGCSWEEASGVDNYMCQDP